MNSKYKIKVNNLEFSYKKDSEFFLNKLNFQFEKGKFYAILGQNGCGKSTLLNCINGTINSYSGNIFISNNSCLTDVKNFQNKQLAQLISYVPQISNANSLSVFDTVMLGRNPYINFSPNKIDYEIVSKTIDELKINHLSLKQTNELSGGELQFTNIGRAFAQRTEILLLDEPTNNLDIKKQHLMFDIIKEKIAAKKICVVAVLHDVNLAMKYADQLLFMKNGSIIASGNKNIVNKNLIEQVYEVQAKIFNNEDEKFIFF